MLQALKIFFYYNEAHSVVVLAVCDCQYKILIDIGDAGHHSNGGVFANSRFVQDFKKGTLPISNRILLIGTTQTPP